MSADETSLSRAEARFQLELALSPRVNPWATLFGRLRRRSLRSGSRPRWCGGWSNRITTGRS